MFHVNFNEPGEKEIFEMNLGLSISWQNGSDSRIKATQISWRKFMCIAYTADWAFLPRGSLRSKRPSFETLGGPGLPGPVPPPPPPPPGPVEIRKKREFQSTTL